MVGTLVAIALGGLAGLVLINSFTAARAGHFQWAFYLLAMSAYFMGVGLFLSKWV